MGDRINRIDGIQRISYNAGRVQRVRNYTPEERSAKIKEIEQKNADMEEVRTYLAKFPNPKHLTFAQLLEQDAGTDEDLDYILDITYRK